ncbi:hypothetical protein CE91St1_46740 [Parabacteroides goldsteinii]|mgnify:CR=1 FL=1|uniref:O-unit flippase-like protein n=2 Tax=Bacteroidales TaxID=171549 RepID=UPI001FB94193|nr:O-unit flippase-like protein [Parabacteroides goldsteinii]GKG75531.1 hypothetical protein CE91St1_46740 [Parabacteroides goldsteinii]
MHFDGITVTKKDVLWGYFAKFFTVASGVLILPLILKLLSPEEVGMNYIMLSVGTLASLVDFGFSPQFARNVTYIYSGAKEIRKEGLSQVPFEGATCIDYSLLATLISTAKWLYRIMGGIVLSGMLTVGTLYIYHVTNGFNDIKNSAIIWVIYSFSVFLQIYYSYFTALLIGAGKIMESNKVIVYGNMLKIFIAFLLLMLDCGLLGLVIANLFAVFLTRLLANQYYFTQDLKQSISNYNITREKKRELFNVIWYNSKKLGFCALSGYLTQGATMMLAGIYLSLNEVGTFGLMSQILFLIQSISGIMFSIYQPRLASLRVMNKKEQLLSEAAFVMFLFNILYIIGIILFLLLGDFILSLIGSQTSLPSLPLLIFAAIIWLLDGNCWNMCQITATKNEFPFVKSVLLTAIAISLFCYINIAWLKLGIIGILIAKSLPQFVHNDWYWPLYTIKGLGVSTKTFIYVGFKELQRKITL